jgi:hypothetical protein
MGWQQHNGQHNRGQTIAANTEVVQWEAMTDGQQRQSQWTVAARLQWIAAAAMGNGWQDSKALAMGGGMVVAQGTTQWAVADCHQR